MATFHDLKHIVKDTIAVDAKQRYTPQEVKFINRNNEFYGIFHGKVDATKLLVSNAELSGCTIFDENGISVDVSNLGKSQEEIKELIKDLNGELYELSTKTKDWISEAVSKLSGSVIENVALSIETISTNLSNEIEGLGTTVTEISNHLDERVSKNENDIKDIKEKQVGAISYRGTIRLFDADTSFHDIFFRNFDDRAFTAEQIDSTVLEQGWMWCVQADDHKKHYLIEGEFIEHGDFIVINRKVQIKEINRDCVDILDMMDFDLSCDTKLDFESVNPVQNKVITNELESLKQIMTGIDTRVEYVEGVLESIPDANDYTKNQVVTVKSSNNIHTEYILCENDDGEKYWKQYVVDGIFERKEFKNQYSDSSANAVEQLSDSNDHYPSSRLVKKIYEDLDKSDKKLIEALEKEVSDREAQDGIISTCLSNKIDKTKTELEKANSIISSELTSAIEFEKNYRINADNAILTTLNDYMEKETEERTQNDTYILSALDEKFESCLTSYNDLSTKLSAEESSRIAKDKELSISVLQEIEARISSDAGLLSAIDSESAERKTSDNSISAGLTHLSAEMVVLSTALSSEISGVANGLSNEIVDIRQVDDEISSRLSSYVKANDKKVNSISTDLSAYKRSNSAEIDEIKQTLVGSVRYMGHITLNQSDSSLSIGQIISNYVTSSTLSDRTVLSNGWMFLVTFGDSLSGFTDELSTQDGVVLTQKDYIVIDNHTPDSGVALSDLSRDTIDIIDVVDDAYVRRSDYDNAKTDISNYVDTKITNLSLVTTELTGATAIKSISQTDGKVSVETRYLSVDELCNAVSFVDAEISSHLGGISCSDQFNGNPHKTIAALSQDNGQISYTLSDLTIDSVEGLTSSISGLSTQISGNAECISAVGLVVRTMNDALSTLYNGISACLYIDDGTQMKTYEEVNFNDTISVCFQLMKTLDRIFKPTYDPVNPELTGTISLYQSYAEALQVMDRYLK